MEKDKHEHVGPPPPPSPPKTGADEPPEDPTAPRPSPLGPGEHQKDESDKSHDKP